MLDHGAIKLRKDWRVHSAGKEGIITAYLPEDDRYAVMFDGKMGMDNWVTFDKITFDEYCEVTRLRLGKENE